MNNYSRFKEEIKQATEKFSSIDKDEQIRIISHLDADGISAAAILTKALQRDNRKYSVSILQQLNREIIEELSKEDYNCFVFTDLGSGQIEDIEKLMGDKVVFILDHHKLSSSVTSENITLINPHVFDIEGNKEISGAGVVFLFAHALNKDNADMSHIAIIGAIGDNQEDKGFKFLNDEILKIAENNNLIKTKKGLRLFGIQTKPLYKVLEYSSDPYIPDVTGSESGAIQFLNKIGLISGDEDSSKKLVHLSEEEMQKLVTGIIMKRKDEDEPSDVLGNVYTLLNEKEESSLRDAKEFSTLLNATGRLKRASLGIAVCLNDKKAKEKAKQVQQDYKKEIVNAMRWFSEVKDDSEDIVRKDNFLIINTKTNILPTMVGTLASMLSRGNDIKDGTVVLTMGELGEGVTKISLRAAGRKNTFDLKEVIQKITDNFKDSEVGGHKGAAGAMIRTEDEDKFIQEANSVLANLNN